MYQSLDSKIGFPVRRWHVIVLAAAFVAVLGLVGHYDFQAAECEHALYCEMIAVWEADAARGVAANDRAGWPPFKGDCRD